MNAILQASVTALCIFACGGCSSGPFATEVTGMPPVMGPTDEIAIKVHVENTSSKKQLLPLRFVVEGTTTIKFVPATPSFSNGLISGDYAITRNSIDVCPPTYDELYPGDHRDYIFTWSPASGDQGNGVLLVSLPHPFSKDRTWPMTITNTEQVAGGQAR